MVSNPVRFSLNLILVQLAFFLVALRPPLLTDIKVQKDEWQLPARLSETDWAANPKIVVDFQNVLHAFWEGGNYIDGTLIIDGIYHAENQDGKWSRPRDILATPNAGGIELGSVVVSPNGKIVVAWGDADSLYLSQADYGDASDPRFWSTSKLLTGRYALPDIAFNQQGSAYIATENDGSIIVLTLDQGLSEIRTELTVMAAEPNKKGLYPRITIDQTDVFHLAWSEISEENEWQSSGVWYARSNTGATSWSNFMFEPNRGNWINVYADGSGLVNLVWEQGVWSNVGRWHKWSTDGGENWSASEAIFDPGPANGLTRWPALAMDSGGILHLVTGVSEVFVEGQITVGNLVASDWNGSKWSSASLIVEDAYKSGALESPDMTISNGNELNLVYHAYENANSVGIWYTNKTLDAPAENIEIEPIEQRTRPPDQINTQDLANLPEVTSSPLPIPLYDDQPKPSSNGSLPLILGIAASMLVIVISIALFRRNQ